ncbi:MAG TPA: M14 family metallopeptidase [Actinomycetota bacterium]
MSVIVEVTARDPRVGLSQLLRLPLGLDVWEVRPPDQAVLRTTEAQAERLAHMGYAVEQLHETDRYLGTFATADAMAGYHSVESLAQDMRALADHHPEIAELHEIGRSIENRPILALRIGERKGSATKVLFMGCHHAREWISVEVPFRLADYLVTNASQAPVSTWLSKAEIWVAPMVNPDGHEFTRTKNRLWRKNRRKNHDGTIGVDPNRNYGYMWGTLNVATSSHTPSDETYVGPRAFSEPETQAVRNLVARELFAGVITYHSYSQLILHPWGYTDKPIVDVADRTQMEKLGDRMAKAIKDVHGKVYKPEQSSDLYPTAGDTTDWTYGEYGIPSFTIELRPVTSAEGGFILPASQIQPTWEENRPAAEEFLKAVIK